MSVGEIEATLRLRDELTAELIRAQQQTKSFGASVTEMAQQAATASATVVRGFRGIESAVGSIISLPGTIRSMVLNPITGGLTSMGAKVTAGVTLPIAGMSAALLKASVNFESGFAGVRKTVDGVNDSMGRLTPTGAAIRQEFRNLAKEVPIALDQLLNIGEIAGQLGVKSKDVVKFTEVIAKIGVTTNLSTEQAAVGLAQLANIMGIAHADFDRLGSTLDRLGSESNATESDILEMSVRLAAAGKIAGLSAADVFGFATALASVGVESEAGGTAFSKVFTQIFEAVKTGSANLLRFAEVAGMSADAFQAMFKRDAAGAIAAFVAGLQKISHEGGNVFDVLRDVEFQDARLKRAILSAAEAGGLLTTSLRTSREEWQANNYLNQEAQQRFQTTASKLTLLWSVIKDVAITLGNALKPALDTAIQLVQTLLVPIRAAAEWFGRLPGPIQLVALSVVGLVAAIGPLMLALSGLIRTFALLSLLSTINVVVGLLSGSAAGATTAVSGLGGALGALASRFPAFGGGLALAVTWLRTGITAILGWLSPLVSVQGAIGLFTSALGGAWSLLGKVAAAALGFVGWPVLLATGFTTLALSIPGVRSLLSNVASIIGSTMSVIKSLAEIIIGSVVGAIASFVSGLIELAANAARAIPGVSKLAQALQVFKDIRTGISEAAAGMREAADAAGKASPHVRELAMWTGVLVAIESGSVAAGIDAFSNAIVGLSNRFKDIHLVNDVVLPLESSIGPANRAAYAIQQAAKRTADYGEMIKKVGPHMSLLREEVARGVVPTKQLAEEWGVSELALEELAKRMQEGSAEAKKFATAQESITASYVPLTAAEKARASTLLALGNSQSEVARYLKVSDAALKVYADGVKNAEAVEKDWKKTHEEWGKATAKVVRDATEAFKAEQRKISEASFGALADQLAAVKEYQEKNLQLGMTGRALQLRQIDVAHKEEIAKLAAKFAIMGALYWAARAQVDKFYQHQRDVANSTTNTIVDRMHLAGFKTRQELQEEAEAAYILWQDMKKNSKLANEAMTADAEKRYKAAKAALRGEAKAWIKFQAEIKGAAHNVAQDIAALLGQGIATGDWSQFQNNLKESLAQFMGAAAAAAVNLVVPGLGTILQPLFKGISDAFLGAIGLGTKGRDVVKEFAASFLKAGDLSKGISGFDRLHQELQKLGAQGEQLWINLTQGVGRNNPAEAARAIDAIRGALDDLNARTQKISEGIKSYITGATTRVDAFFKVFNIDKIRELRKELEGEAPEFDTKGTRVFGAGEQKALEEINRLKREWVNKLGGTREEVQKEYARMGLYAGTAFAQTLREHGLTQALKDTAGMFDQLLALRDQFGFQLEGAAAKFAALYETAKNNADVVQALEGLTQMIRGASDAMFLDQELFSAFGEDAVTQFTRLMERGVDANQALVLMQPTLQQLWEAQQKFGLETDAATQALIDQAVQQGMVGENARDVNEQILDVLKAIAQVLGADLPSAAARFRTELDGLGRVNFTPHIKPIWDPTGNLPYQPPIPGGGIAGGLPQTGPAREPIPQAAGGDWIVRRPTLFLAGEGGHPERATFQPATGRAGGETEVTVVSPIYLDGVKFMEVIAKNAKRLGLVS